MSLFRARRGSVLFLAVLGVASAAVSHAARTDVTVLPLSGIGTQLGTEFGFSAPSILCQEKNVQQLFAAHAPPCKEALLIQIDFSVEARSFTCQLLIFMPRESLVLLHQVLTSFLESL